jgi:hypothetical protein
MQNGGINAQKIISQNVRCESLDLTNDATIGGDLTVTGTITPTPAVADYSLIIERQSNQSVDAATDATVDFDATIENIGTLVIASGIVTIPIDGLYAIECNLKWQDDTSAKQSWILTSLSSRRYGFQQRRSQGSASDSYDINATIRLSASDTVEIVCNHGTGSPVNLEGDGTTYAQRLTIVRIG